MELFLFILLKFNEWVIIQLLDYKMISFFLKQPIYSVLIRGNSEFKPVKLHLKIDLVSYPARAEGLVNSICLLYWRQHPTRHQQNSHLPPITKTIQIRRTRHAGHCWRSKDELISDVLLWTPSHLAKQKQDDQLEHAYNSYVRIRRVAPKTCQKRWMIGRSGERGSEISVLTARHDDDDDDDTYESVNMIITAIQQYYLYVLSRVN